MTVWKDYCLHQCKEQSTLGKPLGGRIGHEGGGEGQDRAGLRWRSSHRAEMGRSGPVEALSFSCQLLMEVSQWVRQERYQEGGVTGGEGVE